ncbi:MAG TPA: DUF2270 domain-containing protein [Planctomycetota bacterium]|nr:DUF2270 domain-containing protein [Planctomycetota bacterium]
MPLERDFPPLDPLPGPEHPRSRADYESTALERSNYITAIVHLYRGEMTRANTWRARLDQTTNWSIIVVASVLGFAFGDAHGNHASLLFAHVLIVILMGLEARRFRFFDVWRARIRKIENNFFRPILERRLQSPEEDWMLLVARDLAEPRFHLTRLEAVRTRLARNYLPIFGVLLMAWVIKLVVHPVPAESLTEVYRRCGIGHVPGWVTLTCVAGFYGLMALLLVVGRSEPDGRDNWDIGERIDEDR